MIQAHKAICCQNLLELNPVNCEVQSFSEWSYNSDTIGTCCQGIIQKKSASGSWTLPCLVIFFQGLILIWKCQKWSLNRGTLVSATAIYQIKCPFTVLSAPFLFFRMLPNDSRLFPGCSSFNLVKLSRCFQLFKKCWLSAAVRLMSRPFNNPY